MYVIERVYIGLSASTLYHNHNHNHNVGDFLGEFRWNSLVVHRIQPVKHIL